MKARSFPLLAFGIAMAMLTIGCSKTAEVQPPGASTSNFEQQMMDLLPVLDGDHVMLVKYTTNPSAGGITPVFYFLPRKDHSTRSGQIDCTGSDALAFGRCCNDRLNANPGKCLTVWKDEGGVYYADDNCNP